MFEAMQKYTTSGDYATCHSQ